MQNKKNFGFTLVELLVSVAIISTLSTIGIASFVSYGHSQTLNTAAMDARNTLETARSRALTQIKPVSCPQSLDGYAVVLGDSVFGENTYQMYVRCHGSGNAGEMLVNRKLPDGVSFSSGTSITFKFRILEGGVDNESAGTPVTSTPITICGFEDSKIITVYSDGRIKTEEGDGTGC